MGSENKTNDETSFQPSEPILCANGCGFFGAAATMNLCSKCYRDLRIKEEQQASAKAAMNMSFNPKLLQENWTPSFSFLDTAGGSSSSSSCSFTFGNVGVGGGDKSEPKVPNRCMSCNKKVGLTGFRCKCGSTFCGAHRYPEKHECTFDFKASGRDAIAKANPVVKADKLDRL
ncbi:hypothetical protein PVL29_001960 [Vitis rotundifolia]|uniref:Zinc finger A20 and AN1 domain-containing stress-associated protein 1 n=1 Tax=Vitis rotundifolia TaxID=103349 RepID=A0AA39AGF7_VITRO|nr:hypothetical protein PVL29_001960 [Vitis rotundifolia]